MDNRFWLLQSVGWLAFTLLQLAAEPADAPVAGVSPVMLALSLSALGHDRQSLPADGVSTCPGGAPERVSDACPGRGLQPGDSRTCRCVFLFRPLGAFFRRSFHSPRCMRISRCWRAHPCCWLPTSLWSLLYVALSRQQSLRRATIAQSDLQLALKEAQLQALLGHLGPHFMFNAINNIRALILKDADAARAMLGKFAATLRYQFNQYDSPLVSVAEEMAVVRDYVDLLRLQLGTRLQYSEQVEEATLSMQVPRHSLAIAGREWHQARPWFDANAGPAPRGRATGRQLPAAGCAQHRHAARSCVEQRHGIE